MITRIKQVFAHWYQYIAAYSGPTFPYTCNTARYTKKRFDEGLPMRSLT